MQTFNRFAGLVIGAIALSFISPHSKGIGRVGGVAIAASSREVAQIAKATTVRIVGKSSGSGVLVAKQGGTYFVLTCRHVVNGKAQGTAPTYRIRTPEGQQYTASASQIRRFDGANLALVPFTSTSSYATAALGDSERLVEGDEIYVSGFPLPANNRNTDLDEFQFTNGIVSSRMNPVRRDGYGFTHTSLTYTGMGGGPVFNSNGQLVGVHCGGDRDSDNTELKTGFNWGIPINTFTKLAQQMGINLGISATSFPPTRDLDNSNPPSNPVPAGNTTNTPDGLVF